MPKDSNDVDLSGYVIPLEDSRIQRLQVNDTIVPRVGTIYFGFGVAPSEWPELYLIDEEGCVKTLRGNPVLLGSDGVLGYELCVPLQKATGYDKDAVRKAVIDKLDEYLDNVLGSGAN